MDPIHQFQIHDIVPMMTMGGRDIAFTNSALVMLIIVLAVSLLMIGGSTSRRGHSWPPAVHRGNVLRVCRQYHPQYGRQ